MCAYPNEDEKDLAVNSNQTTAGEGGGSQGGRKRDVAGANFLDTRNFAQFVLLKLDHSYECIT